MGARMSQRPAVGRAPSGLGLVLALWLVPAGMGVVRAGEPVEQQVTAGIRAYLEGEYQRSRQLLEQALRGKLTAPQRVGALQYLAYSLVGLGLPERAAGVFVKLLELQPAFRLPAVTPPKIVKVFERARSRWRNSQPRLRWHFQEPEPARLGQTIALALRLEGAPAGTRLVVNWRQPPQREWNRQQVSRRADGTWQAALPSPLGERETALQYWFVASTADGRELGRLPPQGAERPFSLPCLPAAEETEQQVSSSNWWLWLAIGVVVAGAGAGLAIGLTRGGESGGRALVHVQVVE